MKPFNNYKNRQNYESVKISLASAEDIYSWSFGEITKPETINYKTYKPEKDGLFDERIFGPVKNFECSCGKYKKIRNKGRVCERCRVEIIESIVRRYRMGHIELNEPVVHIWMLKTNPSQISLLLDIKIKELEEVIYFTSYIVVDSGTSCLPVKSILNLNGTFLQVKIKNLMIKVLDEIMLVHQNELIIVEKAHELKDALLSVIGGFFMETYTKFVTKYTGAKFGIGAAVVRELLVNLNLEAEFERVQNEYTNNTSKSQQVALKLKQRLQVINQFIKSNIKPEWMVLTVLPVIPPDIRPIIQLDSGRFTSSEINDLYRRIIIRNERLKHIKEIHAPMIIINNEKRLLQEAVDALLDNERRVKPTLTKDKREIKSLTSILKGKYGRFRQNLLGKRVDYSGRSVVVVGPDLKMSECGLPCDMALTLFKPFIIEKLLTGQHASNVKAAEKMIIQKEEKIWDILEKVVKNKPILLNRAPTLHRLGIQAFFIKLTKSKAIKLHPLSTPAFNADFDGDQMAVHLPLSEESIQESINLMIGSKNILNPKDGKPIVTPTQDMVLGNYYLTVESKITKGVGLIFSSYQEAWIAYQDRKVDLHSLIGIDVDYYAAKFQTFDLKHKSYILLTTMGKLIFNNILCKDFIFINDFDVHDVSIKTNRIFELTNDFDLATIISKQPLLEPFKKKTLSNVIGLYLKQYGTLITSEMLDKLKDIGFEYSTLSGVSIAPNDIQIYDKKAELFEECDKFITKIDNFYKKGWLTDFERHTHIINNWSRAKEELSKQLEINLNNDKENSLYIMADSGARGTIFNFVQLAGMRGLMKNSKGNVIETPIKSSFKEGMSVLEFFISTHGARKVMVDIALKTADAGYLTRRLVDVAQEVIVREIDCGAQVGFEVADITDAKYVEVVVSLFDRIAGRFSFHDIYDQNDQLLVAKNELIDDVIAKKIISNHITKVTIKSLLTCITERGVCQQCYGIELASGELVQKGQAVGVMAAQSIGEPGTQLTMRTFHTGGVIDVVDITQGLPRVKELFDVTTPKGVLAVISTVAGVVNSIVTDGNIQKIMILDDLTKQPVYFSCSINNSLVVKQHDRVAKGHKLTEGSIDTKDLLIVAGVEAVQKYILEEIQHVYRLQGIEISDKYIEIIIRQMLNKKIIIKPGDTEFITGQKVSNLVLNKINQQMVVEQKEIATAADILLGIKKAPSDSESFLSAASFQDTTRVLASSALNNRTDYLYSLKENVILGNLIPSGTGYALYEANRELQESKLQELRDINQANELLFNPVSTIELPIMTDEIISATPLVDQTNDGSLDE